MDELTLTLQHPLTDEEWDAIVDVDFEYTNEITFYTKNGKKVDFVKKPQWIPCSERLPEPRIDVWCNSDLGQMLGYYDETIEAWYGRDFLELLVNAWMPLPEPYQPEEESE